MTTRYVLELTDSELARYRMMADMARRDEADLWAAAGIAPGTIVADIGCGPGAIAAELATVVGPTGSVLAVDQDDAALTQARALVAGRLLNNVVIGHGDASDTGVAPGSIDVAVVRHVLAHNGGREQSIVDHAASLLHAGGAVLLVDVDLTAQRWVPADTDLAQLQERYVDLHRRRGNDPAVGLRLGQLLGAAGLDVIEHRGWYSLVTPTAEIRPPAWIARRALVDAGLASAGDLERWSTALARLDRCDEPATVFIAMFAAIGRRR